MAKVRKEKVQNTTVTIAAVATPPKKGKLNHSKLAGTKTKTICNQFNLIQL